MKTEGLARILRDRRAEDHAEVVSIGGGNMHSGRFLKLVLMMALMAGALMFGGESALAQLRIVGAISGTVHDTSGAVVANAKVILKDTKTGISKETTASDRGTFLFPDLANGVYEITVSMAGFQTAVLPNVSVSTSQTTDVRITL